MRRAQALVAAMLIAVAAWGVAKGDVFAGTPRTLTAARRARGTAHDSPTFYRDVLPILQGHCEVCHRADGIAPMAYDLSRGVAIRGRHSVGDWKSIDAAVVCGAGDRAFLE